MECVVPKDFSEHMRIDNASERFSEALQVAEKISEAGIHLLPNLDHAAIFTDPPLLVAGPLKKLGYVSGWDARCYPSPVDGHDYINVSAILPDGSAFRPLGWPPPLSAGFSHPLRHGLKKLFKLRCPQAPRVSRSACEQLHVLCLASGFLVFIGYLAVISRRNDKGYGGSSG